MEIYNTMHTKSLKSKIIFGEQIKKLFKFAKENNFAIPAVNCIGNESINAAIEASLSINSPIIIQFSIGGSKYIAGNSFIEKRGEIEASVMGAIHAAKYIHDISKHCEVPIIIHTDHCNKQSIEWIDALLDVGEKFYNKNKIPLFSSHMIDLSTDTLEENIFISNKYLKIMKKIEMTLEIELGCTGGEEDGISGPEINNSTLYTQPEDVGFAYNEMLKIDDNFTVAASFGNVHGVYKPGNVKLHPEILMNSQKYVTEKLKCENAKPINFVFHGGSGSEQSKIEEAINYGVVKINIDTDTQWATWFGIMNYYKKHESYLQGQIGNPEGSDIPNKKYYDPRKWLIYGKQSMKERLKCAFKDFNCININKFL